MTTPGFEETRPEDYLLRLAASDLGRAYESLAAAELGIHPSSRAAAAAPARPDRVNYGDPAHAGKPHKGRITDAERQLVRERFDEINERLAAQGMRTISLADPEHVERYGLEELTRSQAAKPQ